MAQYLEFSGISKAFPGVQALKDITFRAEGGRVLALLGENGAGKSTLLKIMSGDIRADAGTIALGGREMDFTSPNDAIKAGVSVIYQERQLVASMSVAENIFPGMPPRNSLGLVDGKQLRKEAQKLIDEFGLPIDPSDPVGTLSVAYQQMVEIMKAYRRGGDVIAFDEPTAPLTDTEITILFKLIAQLKEAGKVVIYVSHRLNEIFQVTDEIVVLKDGRLVTTLSTAETSEPELIRAMVGRDIGDTYAKLKRNEDIGEVLLEVSNLYTDVLRDVSFRAEPGQTVAFIGSTGSGKSTLINLVPRFYDVTDGSVLIDGIDVRDYTQEALRKKIGYISQRAVMFTGDVTGNIAFGDSSETGADPARVERAARIAQADVFVAGMDGGYGASISQGGVNISGGQKQRLSIARAIYRNPEILVFDDSFSALDYKTDRELRAALRAETAGVTNLIVAQRIGTIRDADRIVVLDDGVLAGMGTHDELMRDCGVYREIALSQLSMEELGQ
jgi:ABC-type sugar transport system ATPase subunit